MDWFDSAFEKWTLMDGLDHRLYFRYRPAPPEFICVMTGDSDGLNYGLWYEDPNEEALCVASFYARDDASIGYCGHTILEAYRLELERSYECAENDEELAEFEVLEKLALLDELRMALVFFETGERTEVSSEYENKYGRTNFQQERYPTLDGFGVKVDGDVSWSKIFPKRPKCEYDLYVLVKDNDKLVEKWIINVRKELKKGNPYPALVLGRDLHASWGKKEYQPIALELMVSAYEALGRQALAEIAKVHHEHRDMKSVEVYRR